MVTLTIFDTLSDNKAITEKVVFNTTYGAVYSLKLMFAECNIIELNTSILFYVFRCCQCGVLDADVKLLAHFYGGVAFTKPDIPCRVCSMKTIDF